jgi:phosphoserine phosphatase
MFAGENCRGQEKVRRLESEYNVNHIDSFYSDSHSDRPLAGIADKAYLVEKGIVREWEHRGRFSVFNRADKKRHKN